MTVAERSMALALRGLNRLAGSEVMDRLGIRAPAERFVYRATRDGFRVAGQAARSFSAVQKLGKPARLKPTKERELFDLTPDDEQQMLVEAFLDFANERLRKIAGEAESTGLSEELANEANELGLTMLGVPEEAGGAVSERSSVTSVLAAEALAYGDAGLTVALLAPAGVATALSLWGDADQQSKYLTPFTSEDVPVAAVAFAEPRALFDPLKPETTARSTADGFVLNGVKSAVPRAGDAELLVVSALLEGRGPALFIVETKTEGVFVKEDPAMGLRAAQLGQVRLENVTVPKEALLGEADPEVFSEAIARSRLAWAAVGAGLTLPVEPLALGDIRLEGARPVETYDDYDALVAGLEEHPGGVALVPVETVDWRVNVLAVDGIDPIRSTVVPAGYPFGQQLIAAVAADQPEEIDNAVQRAFARLGWPHRAPVITRIGVAGDIATNADGAELASLAPLIASLDLTIGNLGSGTSAATPTASTPAASSGESALASALADAGFDVISLITGESDDQTDRALREAGLETIGSQSPNSSQEPLIIERNGVRIAIVAARNDTTVPDPTNPEGASPTPLDPVALADEVQRLAAETDLVIVLLHVDPAGGDEPDPDMIAAARLAIDSGADAVVMTGAAGVSGMESYRDQPVLYGLGGLTGGGEAVETRQSAIVEFVCHGDRLVGLRLHGIEQDARGQPRLMTEAERAAFLDRLWRKMPEREDR